MADVFHQDLGELVNLPKVDIETTLLGQVKLRSLHVRR